MHRWADSPIVTLSRGDQALELGRSGREPTLHLHGTTGLGLPPADVATADRLAGHGSVVRGVRYEARPVFLPILMEAPSTADLTIARRDLYRLLAPHLGPVEVRVQDPGTDTDRMIRGYLREGLTGDFGDTFHGSWQTLGLDFLCPDPWWMGAERVQTFRVNPGVKPFISTTVDFFPVILAQSTVMGRFEVQVYGDGPAFPVWEVMGPGEDLIISDGTNRIQVNGTFKAGEVVRIDTREGRIVPDRWADVTLDSRLFSLPPGRTTLTVTMVGATEATTVSLSYRERYLEAI